ncbi:helix-turn-helix transcriptional regulator [Arthrobacter woluwensis]|uniref:helix-turn-helix transcriptional regulator n=1 Tax=Arthrobacter woluwensis TaxID=156980 RepID=UPI001AAE8B1D|nr:helix-turn-helix domain-containing protein [Arthrobacter woluwensis]QTF71756.1 helix-turn-helix domain-containing protein [Arthrobacter woluwensis]
MNQQSPRLWTPSDVEAFLGLSRDQVKRLRTSGDGPPFVKIGREVRYVPAKVQAWCLERQQASTKAAAR